MKIGCCYPIEQAAVAKAVGFDYLECPLASLRAEEDDAAFAPVLDQYRAAALPVWAFNYNYRMCLRHDDSNLFQI